MTYEQWAAQLIKDKPRFEAYGRTREALDCWGLVILGHKEVEGRELPSLTEHYEKTDVHGNFHVLTGLIKSQLPDWDEIEIGKEKAGDVIVLRPNGHPIHVGLVYAKSMMVHIEQGIEACSEKFTDSFWRRRIVGIYRARA